MNKQNTKRGIMMEGWRKILLGELLEINTESIGRNYPFEKINYFDISSVKSGFIEGIDRIFFNNAPSRAKRIVKTKDTILSTVRPRNRSFYYFKEAKDNDIASTGFAVLRPKLNKIDDRYLYYLVTDYNFTAFLASNEKGAAYPAVTPDVIERAKINLPPLLTQRKIANILSAYDDLIENNLKRIKLLEEMAQITYEEWFVYFKFPGYENTIFDEKTGLPEMWKRVKLGSVIDVGRGSSPRPIANQVYFDGGTIPWLKIADATASHIFIYKTKEYVNEYGASFSKKLPAGSLIIAASGTLGFPMFLGVECCIHDGWIYFEGIKTEMKEYFYFSFINLKEYFNAISYGAAIQNINTGILKGSPFILPTEELLLLFHRYAKSIFNNIQNLQIQNQGLKEARDILLPRLMMGMIDPDALIGTSVDEINLFSNNEKELINLAAEPKEKYGTN